MRNRQLCPHRSGFKWILRSEDEKSFEKKESLTTCDFGLGYFEQSPTGTLLPVCFSSAAGRAAHSHGINQTISFLSLSTMSFELEQLRFLLC